MTPTPFDDAHTDYLHSRERGILCTIAPNGTPQAKPVGFALDDARGSIEIAGYDMEHSAKFRNVAGHPQVAFVVEDVPDAAAGADGVRFVEVRGPAEQVRRDAPPITGLSRWTLRVHPRRIVSYNVAGTGLHREDVSGPPESERGTTRPATRLRGRPAEAARTAAQRQVDELQAGLDAGDAAVFNAHFADDVIWGTPYGATVVGYDTLHAIHSEMLPRGDHGGSRYELVQVSAVTPEVTVAQVRRNALSEDGEPVRSGAGEPRFSEMATYVLVQRGGDWWLAAGQNTILDVDHGAVRA